MYCRKVLLLWIACIAVTNEGKASSETLTFGADRASFYVQPDGGKFAIKLASGKELVISEEQLVLRGASRVLAGETSASWTAGGAKFAAAVVEGGLELSITGTAGTSITWPRQPLPGDEVRSLMLPRRQGQLVPLDDAEWRKTLTADPMNTLEDLSMPFWGGEGKGGVWSMMLDTQFHNEILVDETSDGLQLQCTHLFVAGEPDTIRYRFRFDEGSKDLLLPALEYRKFLKQTEKFVSLQEKARVTPEVSKLPGAFHVYLWGGGALTVEDLAAGKARELAKELVGADGESSMGKLLQHLPDETRKAVAELAGSDYPNVYAQQVTARGLNELLLRADGFGENVAPGGDGDQDIIAKNKQLLFEMFPGKLPPVETWGGGLSREMLESLKGAGLSRLRLGLGGWEETAANPEFSKVAADIGYLVGPYDSYHSIHDPALKGKEGTWPTAQFDQALYETGGIVDANGRMKKGFQQIGYLLSPLAAWPYVQRRVRANYEMSAFNYYFFDCDGFGQVYDDFSPLHRATEMSDAAERVKRLEWVAKEFGAVIGTEGGSAYAAGAVHIFEGVFQDGFGWGDADLKDRKSPYFLGAYFPPEAPAIFFKPVPAKDKYVREEFDPRFRLPLFEAVYHDSVVSGHHWSVATPKFSTVETTVVLTEMLYQVPPMYHLNPKEFRKRRGAMVEYFKVFSPLHQVTALLPLRKFERLTEDGLVQRTTFGGPGDDGDAGDVGTKGEMVKVIANFSGLDYFVDDIRVPPGGVGWSVAGKRLEAWQPSSP